MLYDSLEEWDGVGSQGEFQEGGDIFVFVTYSFCYMAEANIILKRNYLLTKINF